MKINNTDISAYCAKQFNVEYEHAAQSNGAQWSAGALLPFLGRNRDGFSNLTITLLVKSANGRDREEIKRNCSDILALLTGPVTIELDGFETKYRAILQSHTETERSIRQYHLLKLTFLGYEFGLTRSYTGTGSVTVNNPGNMRSPVVLSITPSAAKTELIIEGFGLDDIVIRNAAANVAIVVDGNDGSVSVGGSSIMSRVDMWDLPAVGHGNTTITCNDSGASMSASVTPLYR